MNKLKSIIIAAGKSLKGNSGKAPGGVNKIKPVIVAFVITGGLAIIWMWAMVSQKETTLSEKSKPSIEEIKGKPSIKEIKSKLSNKEINKEKKEVVASPPQEEERPLLVRTYKVKKRDFQDALSVMGTVKGRLEIDLRFELNGVIKAIYFRQGEKIKKGDIIATLDDREGLLKLEYAQSKLKAARVAYEASEKKHEIFQGLYDAGAIIKVKLEEVRLESENARLQAETVKTELKLAQVELDKTILRSPRSGIMGSRDAEIGEFVTPNAAKVASLVVTDKVDVEVGIIERDIDKIQLGQKAVVNVDAYSGKEFRGEIDNISPIVEGRSRTLTARIRVVNPGGLLLPGMFARSRILLAEFKNAIIIPADSLIILSPQKQLVPVVNSQVYSQQDIESGVKPGELELREVAVGYRSSDYVYITSGLKEEELVIIETQGQLQAGVKVKVVGVEETAF